MDGDYVFQEDNEGFDCNISMPYLSGMDLVNLCNMFGLAMQYDSRSRWMYMDELMEHCIQNDNFNSLLKYLFSEQNFEGVCLDMGKEVFQKYYNLVIECVIERINSILYFGKHELQFIDGNFYVVESGKAPVIDFPTVKLINMEYIHGLRERCENDFLGYSLFGVKAYYILWYLGLCPNPQWGCTPLTPAPSPGRQGNSRCCFL